MLLSSLRFAYYKQIRIPDRRIYMLTKSLRCFRWFMRFCLFLRSLASAIPCQLSVGDNPSGVRSLLTSTRSCGGLPIFMFRFLFCELLWKGGIISLIQREDVASPTWTSLWVLRKMTCHWVKLYSEYQYLTSGKYICLIH